MTCLNDPWHEGFLPKLFNLHVVNLCESLCSARLVVEPLSGCGDLCSLLVFLNAYRNNPQAHGITVVAFHLEVFRVLYFHKERMCKSLLASTPKVTRRRIARVVRFSKDRDPKLR